MLRLIPGLSDISCFKRVVSNRSSVLYLYRVVKKVSEGKGKTSGDFDIPS